NYLLIASLFYLTITCKPTEVVSNKNNDQPQWLTALIQELKQEAPANPPAKIYRYTYNNQEVYYLTGRCCDIPSKLFDKDGNQLCQPDGGITGRGDGRCPDFFEKRQNETIIWEDTREN